MAKIMYVALGSEDPELHETKASLLASIIEDMQNAEQFIQTVIQLDGDLFAYTGEWTNVSEQMFQAARDKIEADAIEAEEAEAEQDYRDSQVRWGRFPVPSGRF